MKAAAKRNTIGTENGALKYHQVQAHLLSERMSSAVCLDKGLCVVSKATVGTNTGSDSFHSKTFSLLEAEICQHMESLS